jgi:hypothetical protein
MEQQALFFERIEEAIDTTIHALGGRKKVAGELWPDKPVRDAHNLLDACLNPERRERLTPSQVMFLARRGREVGCHVVMQFLARECGYAEPVPLDPRDERAVLQQQFIASVAAQKQLLARWERISAAPGSPPLTITPLRA